MATVWGGGRDREPVASRLHLDVRRRLRRSEHRLPIGGSVGCWVHRDNILSEGLVHDVHRGHGLRPRGGNASMAAVFVLPSGATPPLSFTWRRQRGPISAVAPAPLSSAELAAEEDRRVPEKSPATEACSPSTPVLRVHGRPALNAPIVGMALDPWTGGYWEVAWTGRVRLQRPVLRVHGRPALNAPIVGIAADPLPADTGRSPVTAAVRLQRPVLRVHGRQQLTGSGGGDRPADPATGGYREVASDGGMLRLPCPVLRVHGPASSLRLRSSGWPSIPGPVATGRSQRTAVSSPSMPRSSGPWAAPPSTRPVVGIAADPGCGGYWEVASDGGVFAFHAPFFGSVGGVGLAAQCAIAACDTARPGSERGHDSYMASSCSM